MEGLDIQRMIFGDQTATFLLEVTVRTIVVYAYTLGLLRWLGSRTIGQLSTVEFLLVIALGSAVGDPMFYPDVPLAHSLLVVTLVVLANKGLDVLIVRSKLAERAIDGKARQAIRDGVITRELLNDTTLGASELHQQLRHKDIEHLGQVAQAYVEADGRLTVFRAHAERPGLPIVPPWEVERPREISAALVSNKTNVLACWRCGTTITVTSGSRPGVCPHCHSSTWTAARGGQTDGHSAQGLVGSNSRL